MRVFGSALRRCVSLTRITGVVLFALVADLSFTGRTFFNGWLSFAVLTNYGHPSILADLANSITKFVGLRRGISAPPLKQKRP